MSDLQVRHGRTPAGVPLAALSLGLGLYGALDRSARSGAVERSFSNALATGWYAVMAAGALLLLLALWQRWPSELDPDTAGCMVNRLYLERAGLCVVGGLWQSYAFAALSIQGSGGATAAALATVIGSYMVLRIRQQVIDLPALRAWIAAATRPLPVVEPPADEQESATPEER